MWYIVGMNSPDVLCTLLGIALVIVGFFLKRILDKLEDVSEKLDTLWEDLHDTRPKVDVLWENRFR